MSADRELLELAAKAAGLEVQLYEREPHEEWGAYRSCLMHEGREWNPLTDDGDALRLAVILRLVPDFRGCGDSIPASVAVNIDASRYPLRSRSWVRVEYVPEAMLVSGNKSDVQFANYKLGEAGAVRGIEAAVRRAIVIAAAYLQRSREGAAS